MVQKFINKKDDNEISKEEIKKLTGLVFEENKANPDFIDHRGKYWWVSGFLGNFNSEVIFLALNPSLKQMKIALRKPELQDENQQWNVSPGDKHIFRKTLLDNKFIEFEDQKPSEWKCYITDMVKMGVQPNEWNNLPEDRIYNVTKGFARVIRKEIEIIKPKLIVTMGDDVDKSFRKLVKNGEIEFPTEKIIKIIHYATFNYGKQEKRQKEYQEQFKKIRESLS